MVLSRFDAAWYANDLKKIADATYKDTGFFKLITEERTAQYYSAFNKFEPGYRIVKTSRFTISSQSKIVPGKQVIHLNIAKKAKKDGQERTFDAVDLVNDNGKWKVLRFHFPDFIDY